MFLKRRDAEVCSRACNDRKYERRKRERIAAAVRPLRDAWAAELRAKGWK
jgi:hypothetical protein